MSYVGRFAPSPSGPLHFGSLVAALGSYLRARSLNGQWLVRIEDIDPPREMAGADTLILNALEQYGLQWDGNVRYQSQQHERYQATINQWLTDGSAYRCTCSRKMIKESGGFYRGHCRNQAVTNDEAHAIRIKVDAPIERFWDEKHGWMIIPRELAEEDFIIRRRDGLIAYNLAVVLDDIDQGITEVVRGADLIEPTGRQICLYQILNAQPITYLHLPLAMDDSGYKLSKQNRAPAIDDMPVTETLIKALKVLGLPVYPDLALQSVDEIIKWGEKNWALDTLPNTLSVTV